MPKLLLETFIMAPIQIVFNLSRSIDLHTLSTAKTNETAIAGVTSGLIELGETVTWHAKHFGIYQKLSTKITSFDSPTFFQDEMTQGIFKSFTHQHHFAEQENKILMTDIYEYQSPLGILGKLADWLFLEKYMTRFLLERNEVVKGVAESGAWKQILMDL